MDKLFKRLREADHRDQQSILEQTLHNLHVNAEHNGPVSWEDIQTFLRIQLEAYGY